MIFWDEKQFYNLNDKNLFQILWVKSCFIFTYKSYLKPVIFKLRLNSYWKDASLLRTLSWAVLKVLPLSFWAAHWYIPLSESLRASIINVFLDTRRPSAVSLLITWKKHCFVSAINTFLETTNQCTMQLICHHIIGLLQDWSNSKSKFWLKVDVNCKYVMGV